MSAPENWPRASWHVKLDRAKEHFVEFEAEARRYLDGRPYEIRREHQGKPKTNHWRYVLRVVQQPDPRLAAIMGDVLHNVRSALDHVFYGMLPPDRRRSINAIFPVMRDPIAKNDTGQILLRKGEEGKRFNDALRGLSRDAVACICELQPGVSKTPELHPLGILSRLENLDKHRDLIRLVFALSNARSAVTRSGHAIGGRELPGLCEDGTVVERFGFHPHNIPAEAEVRVEVHGTGEILMEGPVKNSYGGPSQLLRILVDDVPRNVIPVLEPFVRS